MTANLALRELWISFRLLVVLGLFVAAGVIAAFAPFAMSGGLAPPTSAAVWYAVGLALAAAGTAALGAAAFAGERRRGGLAWMAARAVPRPLLLFGWLAALVAVMLAGLLPSALLAWLSVSAEPVFVVQGGSPLAFGVAVLAATADALAWIAAGLVAGTLLRPRLAASVTLLLIAAIALLAILMPDLGVALPIRGVALLAEVGPGTPSLAAGLQAAGVSLLVSAALMVAGVAALSRRDL